MDNCKLSAYKNCGPMVNGTEYCLFHKPSKSREERREFYKELKKLDGIEEKSSTAWNPLGVNEHTRFVFKDYMDFRGYYFPKIPVSDDGFAFGFGNAVFEETVDFTMARFYRSVFSRSIFHKDAIFKGASMMSGEFDDAKFFGKARFVGSYFVSDINFQSIYCEGSCDFTSAYFAGDVDFSYSTFNSNCRFDKSVFENDVDFSYTSFNSGVSIISPSEVSKDMDISRSDFSTPDFIPDEIYGDYVENMVNSSHRLNTNKAKREAYRIQKLSYKSKEIKRETDQMFKYEMRASRNLKYSDGSFIDSLKAWNELVVADLTCEYGTNWQRILAVSAITVGLFSVIYWALDTFSGGGGLQYSSTPPMSPPCLYFYYSLSTFTTLGLGDVTATGITGIISTIEAGIGIILSALIVAVFVRKWVQ